MQALEPVLLLPVCMKRGLTGLSKSFFQVTSIRLQLYFSDSFEIV